MKSSKDLFCMCSKLAEYRSGGDDKVKRQSEQVGWVILVMSQSEVTLFRFCLTQGTEPVEMEEGKSVLSLITESQDCPCWSKEACHGLPRSTDKHFVPRRGRTRPKCSPGQRARSATRSTSRRNKDFILQTLWLCAFVCDAEMCAKSFLW